MLAEIAEDKRALFATALLTGLRKGELRALRKVDVDLEKRTIHVVRSGTRDTTKGGHQDVIHIAAELLPCLRAAIAASKSDLVFPGPDGKSMMREDVKLAGALRSAMGRAGIVEGYEHRCRKRKCKHRETLPDAEERRCPKHGVILWPVAKVRKLRWHDMRHSTASNLMPAGVAVTVIQRQMRHRDIRMTTEVYGHLAPDFVLREIDKLTLGLPPPPEEEEKQDGAAGLLQRLLQASGDDAEAVEAEEEIPPDLPGFRKRLRQDSNLLPPASKAGALSR